MTLETIIANKFVIYTTLNNIGEGEPVDAYDVVVSDPDDETSMAGFVLVDSSGPTDDGLAVWTRGGSAFVVAANPDGRWCVVVQIGDDA
jgi:hypothetical protein